MEALTFILQRFFWGFGGGCIFNFFIIINYKVLVKNNILPSIPNIAEIPWEVAIWIFIAATVIVSIIIEGINQVGFEFFEVFKKKMQKNDDSNGKNEFKKCKWCAKPHYFIYRRTTTVDVCLRIKDDEDAKNAADRNPMYASMRDLDRKTAVKVMQERAIWISETAKSKEVYHFRDLSFMVQLMRTSFYIISFISFLAAAIFFRNTFLFKWYLWSFGVSKFFFLLTTPIAICFSKRYVRDIIRWYSACGGEKGD